MKNKYMLASPSNGKAILCSTFEEAIKYFERYNPPRLIREEKLDESIKRVNEYFKSKREKRSK